MNKTGLFRRRRDEDVPGYIKKKSMTKSQSKKKEEYDRERCYHHYGQRNDSGTDQCIRWTESRHGVATRSYPPAIWGSGICGHPCHDVRRLVVHTHKLADSALSRYFGLQEGENFCQLVIGNAKWSDPSLSLLGSRKRRNGSAATNKKDEIEILKWTQKMQRFPLVNLLREA